MFIRIPENLKYEERQIHLLGYRQWLEKSVGMTGWKITALAPQRGLYQITFSSELDALAFKLKHETRL